MTDKQIIEQQRKEIKFLHKQLKDKDEVIEDLAKGHYKEKCLSLEVENAEIKKKLKMYEEKFQTSRNQIDKDSSNSCKPSSTNGYKKIIQNNRIKTGRKPGRGKGHKRSAPQISENPDEIKHISKVATCTCGCKTIDEKEVSRDLISLEVIVHTTRYTGMKTKCPCCHKEYQPHFPKELKSIINYDDNLKAAIVYLSSYCNVTNEKISKLLNAVSNGKINMCNGTTINTMKSFSAKSKAVLEKIKKEILKSPVINEDETPITVNGKINSTIGVFTKEWSLISAFKNRKLESFKEMGILDKYIGTVCHDHNAIHQNFVQSIQAECNFHILRYCKGEYEIHKRESIKNFMDYLLELRDKVSEKKAQKIKSFSDEEYEKSKKKYLELLDEWDKEFAKEPKNFSSQYYKSERCLKKRLRDYVDDHLRFLKDFRIDFTNNLAERGLRKIKTKLKIAGTFRNLNNAKYYCDAISIIDTCIKQKENIFDCLKNIFEGKKKIFAF